MTTAKTLMLAVALTLSACGPVAAHDPGSAPGLDGGAGSLPQLNALQRASFSYPYSCQPGGKLAYEGSALFLSDYSRQRNAPDLLYNGACGSTDYIEAATAGDDFALIADLGAVPLEQVTASMAFNHRQVSGGDNTFTQTAPVVVGHTYAVLISKSDIRALFVLRVEQQVSDGPMTISYAVKSYAIQQTAASAPGFGWSTPSTGTVTPAGTTVRGTIGLGGGVACGTDPSNDCRGLVFIGVIDQPHPLPLSKLLGSAVIPVADLSGGRRASYSISGLPSGASYIAAMLVEEGTPGNPPYPKPGDIVQAPQAIQLQAGATLVLDLALDNRW